MSERGGRTTTGVTVAVLEGDIDAANAHQIHEIVSEMLGGDHQTLVVDLSGVTFMDSQGINALIWAEQRIKAAGARLLLRRPSQPVRSTLEVAGIDTLFVVET
jgi:anti-anti-sigma factor